MISITSGSSSTKVLGLDEGDVPSLTLGVAEGPEADTGA